eukprot:TRINITY_DN24968_c0_g1_i3.p1 TRINITY_DN24968_c0_g1~~TRINITY_DN24968_c0_g1_i3.p1  ORF type:complete len:245 (-),score=34.43 TRINITY_DN24968_c0_g1_i3:434-1168(-)
MDISFSQVQHYFSLDEGSCRVLQLLGKFDICHPFLGRIVDASWSAPDVCPTEVHEEAFRISQSKARTLGKGDINNLQFVWINGHANPFCLRASLHLPGQIEVVPEKSSLEESWSCVFCLEGVEEKPTACCSLPCRHVFHNECLQPWIKKNERVTCPVCRAHVQKAELPMDTSLDGSAWEVFEESMLEKEDVSEAARRGCATSHLAWRRRELLRNHAFWQRCAELTGNADDSCDQKDTVMAWWAS